ncbi:MAG: UDP-N-acetylmuramoyl-tripeptide--D-alanyl-D-alanine ligase, partial [Phycisphaeraceae bacterium]|nr:UDP-N-acetylmuramoyl-tripeptide--D-alanyl-D-alanine ligase [Phycisphaeraceae bacterium]
MSQEVPAATDSAPSASADALWPIGEIGELLAGEWLNPPADPQRPIMGVNTDSRSIEPGEAFVALKGDRFDGHDFLEAATEAGAALLIVSRSPRPGPGESIEDLPPVYRVDDTLIALQRLGAAWRDELAAAGTKVVAITGSNGKTTTRHLTRQVLEATGSAVESPRSFNNHIGVPLTLLLGRRHHDYLIAEVGTNHPGEIDELAAIVRPDIAVITSIGSAHLEQFADLDAVAKEKSALLNHVQPGGRALVLGDEPAATRLTPYLPGPDGPTLERFGEHADCEHRVQNVAASDEGVQFEAIVVGSDPVAVSLPLVGRHNATNALAALIVGAYLGISPADGAKQLAGADGAPMRLAVEVIETAGAPVTVINDAYNANPDSMAASLETLAGFNVAAGGRRIAILGDMLELGDAGPDLHRELGERMVRIAGIQAAVLIGPLAMFIAETASRGWNADRVHAEPDATDEAIERTADRVQAGDTVLVKASRG